MGKSFQYNLSFKHACFIPNYLEVFYNLAFEKNVRSMLDTTMKGVYFNPLGPRILLKHATMFLGFLANFERFYLLVLKKSRKNYSILIITSCVYFEE